MWDFRPFAGRIAATDEFGGELRYEDLVGENEKIGKALGKRCLVFILCSNALGCLAGYTGCLNSRSVPLLLAQHLDYELLDHLMETYQPSYLWLPEDQAGQFPNMVCVYRAFGYALLETGYGREYPLHDDLALLLTTSGSTGSPKLVRQSYENVMDNAKAIARYLDLDEKERPITTLPMNYTYGLSIINSHLLVGAAVLLTDRSLMQKEFWSFFREAEATSFGGVPYTYEMLDRLRFFKMDLPSLKAMTQAGGKLTPELHEKFAKFAAENGKKFIVMYGQCEATARMGYLPADKAVEKKGSMGIAIPGGKFRLVDGEGDEITDPYVTGELVYEGKNVTMGYAECGDDLIKGDERHGILQTGDMAQFDGDGYYYIVGRKKRFLKIYGNRVNLDEVERLVKGKFGIEVACGGVDDYLYVFVADKSDSAESMAEEARLFVAGKTGLNPAAFHAVVLDEIPKNDSGKVRYGDLEKYYGR